MHFILQLKKTKLTVQFALLIVRHFIQPYFILYRKLFKKTEVDRNMKKS